MKKRTRKQTQAPRIRLTPPRDWNKDEPLPYYYEEKMPWDNYPTTPHNKSLSVAQIVDEYLKSPRWDILTQKTKDCYTACLIQLDEFLIYTGKSIYKMPAYKVTYSTVDYLHKVLGFVKSPATVRQYFCVMNNVWDLAVRNGRVFVNPWLKPRIKVSNERDVTWTREQVYKAIYKAKELEYDTLALYILFAYETVQRPWKDLRNLAWSNIKADDKGRQYIDFEISKTKTHLLLPLSADAVKALETWPRISTLVFVSKNGQHLTFNQLHKQFQRVRKDADLPHELQIRDLRRTGITELAESGCNSLEIEAITGWRCPETVIRRYARVRLKTAQHALQKREQGRLQEGSGVC